MARQTVSTPVKGGSVARDARTGRFVAVETRGEVSRASAVSARTVAEASAKRHAALERLANR